MRLRILTETDLRAALDMPAAIQAVRAAFEALSTGRAHVPVRQTVEAPGVTLLSMPAFLRAEGEGGGAALGSKLVTVAPGNRERGLPAIHALVVLLDPETGAPRAALDGEWLTALRTGAGSGVATDLLARPDAEVLGVIGAGPQARTQIEAVRAVRAIRDIRIRSRSGVSAERLASTLIADGIPGVRAVSTVGEALRDADVVVTATDSLDPVVEAAALRPGVHVNAVGGYRRDMQELATEVVAEAEVVAVDQLDAALREAGDVWVPLDSGRIRREDLVEIGALAAAARVHGTPPGGSRPPGARITVFKSVGNAVQDLAVGGLALANAEARGLGTVVGE
jgi:ornithine cyclodeaminase